MYIITRFRYSRKATTVTGKTDLLLLILETEVYLKTAPVFVYPILAHTMQKKKKSTNEKVSSGMWRHANWYKFTDISEEGVPPYSGHISLVLKMQAASSSETSVNIYQTTRRDIPEYCILCKFQGQQGSLCARARTHTHYILRVISLSLSPNWTAIHPLRLHWHYDVRTK